MVLVRTPHSKTLRAVLTCGDRLLAERVAHLLNQANSCPTGFVLLNEIEHVAAELPDAPRASFRQALEHVYAATWPLGGEYIPTHDDVRDCYDYEQSGDLPVTPGTRDQLVRTPSDAKLKELTGPVVRIFRLTEYHVVEMPRMLEAARQGGWEPDEEDDEDGGLLGAVMWLADEGQPAGCDMVTDASEGVTLNPARDEVLDWSSERVGTEFWSGWRLRAAE